MNLLHQTLHAPSLRQVGPANSGEFGVRVPPVLAAYRVNRPAIHASRLGTPNQVRHCGSEGSAGDTDDRG